MHNYHLFNTVMHLFMRSVCRMESQDGIMIGQLQCFTSQYIYFLFCVFVVCFVTQTLLFSPVKKRLVTMQVYSPY